MPPVAKRWFVESPFRRIHWKRRGGLGMYPKMLPSDEDMFERVLQFIAQMREVTPSQQNARVDSVIKMCALKKWSSKKT